MHAITQRLIVKPGIGRDHRAVVISRDCKRMVTCAQPGTQNAISNQLSQSAGKSIIVARRHERSLIGRQDN